MNPNIRIPALAIAALSLSATAAAQSMADAGKLEYQWHCATCHGDGGTGNGELAKWLTVKPSDLTTISKRNGGAFPNQLVWEIIDGRTEVKAHGARDMPVWGQRYRKEALADPATAAAPEWAVRNRVVSLLDYLSRIQQK